MRLLRSDDDVILVPFELQLAAIEVSKYGARVLHTLTVQLLVLPSFFACRKMRSVAP